MDSELGERRRGVSPSESRYSTQRRDGGKNAARLKSYSDFLERVCPQYIAYGMSYDEYWNGDNEAPKMYRLAYQEKMRHENQMAWVQGMYVYEAIMDVAPILRAFSKARRPHPFRDAPYEIFAEDKEKREQDEAMAKYERMKEKVAAFADAFNKRTSEGGT